MICLRSNIVETALVIYSWLRVLPLDEFSYKTVLTQLTGINKLSTKATALFRKNYSVPKQPLTVTPKLKSFYNVKKIILHKMA